MDAAPDWIDAFIGTVVVADLDEDFLVIGLLERADERHLAFSGADLHDHREANCTKEVYCLESKQIGVRTNRRAVVVPRSRLVALSRLEDC